MMKTLFARRTSTPVNFLLFLLALCACMAVLTPSARAQVTIAQISDTHLGEAHSPHAFDNLRRAVDMANARHPDAVIVSGDIGENYDEWLRARGILKWLHAPVYYAPGNHDVHSNDVQRYREVFGPDYYRFQVKGVTFLVIDSQLLGNFDNFDAPSPQPMPRQTEAEGEKMLSWLSHQGGGGGGDRDDRSRRHWWNRGKNRTDLPNDGQRNDDQRANNDGDDQRGGIVIGIQHIPAARGDNMPPDQKPYWVVNDPYRSREIEILHRLGVTAHARRALACGHYL